jgi:hypothetical protein
VLYLASRASIFANGTRLRVDGGAVQKVRLCRTWCQPKRHEADEYTSAQVPATD